MSTASRVLLFFAPVLFAGAVSAQQTTAPAAHQIVLDVVVTAKSGKPVAELREQDFTVLDNKAKRSLTSFRAVSGDEPLSVIIVIDAVNTTYQNVNFERQQINNFLRANGGHLARPTSLAFFTDTGTKIQQGFSTDGNALSADLDQYAIGLRTIPRSTGVYGAEERLQLSLTALHLLAGAEAKVPGRKMILWVSPGWPLLTGPGIDLTSKQQDGLFTNIVTFSHQLRQSRITLYSVDPLGAGQSARTTFYYETFLKGISTPRKVDFGDLGLQVLAVQSGGLALNSNNDIAALLQRCLDDAGAYYELTFDSAPAEHRDEYHSLEIQLAQPKLTGRTRTGYYAQP